MRWMAAGVAALALASPGGASAMSVAEFLAKAEALRAKGLGAMASPDIRLLRDEVEAASGDYRKGVEADAAAGRPARSCPPPRGKAKLSSKDLIAAFVRIPPAQRNVSVKSAFASFMTRRFPCPG